MMLFNQFKQDRQIAVLIDPEKCTDKERLNELLQKVRFAGVQFLFVGGSTVTREDFQEVVRYIKSKCDLPLVIFPGAAHHLAEEADALLYLSLISGRNPDYLIGHHVTSAHELFDMDIEVIPTAYMLIDGGTQSSVAYVSQTTPIPADKHVIALNTAKAGLLLGKQLIYLDAGSGAKYTVPTDLIRLISALGTPLIIGGGVRSAEQIEAMHDAGANIVVIGNKLEEDLEFLLDIRNYLIQQ